MNAPCSRLPVALLLSALVTTSISAQSGTPAPSMRGDGPAPESKPFNITRSDPGLDAVVAADTKAELIASGFGLNEGPVWVRDGQSGYLLVSGLLDNVIYKVAADKTVSVFMEKAGYTGTDVNHTGTQTRSGRSHVLLIGPSCASLDSQGRLIWCADNDRAVMRLEKDGTRTVLSPGSNGKKYSGPNDIVVGQRRCGVSHRQRLRPARRRTESGQATAQRHLPDQGWAVDDGARRDGARRHPERRCALAR
jgi:hypothetical protein